MPVGFNRLIIFVFRTDARLLRALSLFQMQIFVFTANLYRKIHRYVTPGPDVNLKVRWFRLGLKLHE
jgi:hypothetical protein